MILRLLLLLLSGSFIHFINASSSPRPLVIWHGLGDSYASPGMIDFVKLIKGVHPGIFVHSVYIEVDLKADRQAGFYGNVNTQIELVAEQLADIEELQGGFDAMGFSQAGQFLRAYVERYNSPPVRNLITFGSQHMGVSDIPTCRPGDFLCQIARRATKAAVYSAWAQENLVQAQYFRDPANLDTYFSANNFLTSINNELPLLRNETYAHNLASLENLVLIIFSEDQTVVPKESSWFGSEIVLEEGLYTSNGDGQSVLRDERMILPMRDQPLYREDWIGLRTLDERGAVHFETCVGEHMHLGDCWNRITKQFAGAMEG